MPGRSRKGENTGIKCTRANVSRVTEDREGSGEKQTCNIGPHRCRNDTRGSVSATPSSKRGTDQTTASIKVRRDQGKMGSEFVRTLMGGSQSRGPIQRGNGRRQGGGPKAVALGELWSGEGVGGMGRCLTVAPIEKRKYAQVLMRIGSPFNGNAGGEENRSQVSQRG